MTNGSTENLQVNDNPSGYNTFPDTTQSQTAILIENEQLRAENEVARAVLTAHRRQQEENSKCCSGPGAAFGLVTAAIIIYNTWVLIYNASL